MSEEIRVHVVSYGRKYLYMRYRDPVTGKTVARSTQCTRRRDAERAAAKWEAELREGRYKPPSKITWVEFRHRYEDEVLPSLADRTGDKISGVFNAVEKHCNPERLTQLTAERISHLQAELRKAGRSDATIKGILAHLQAALRWAKDHGLLNEVPKIAKPKRAARGDVMKGRPITTEEFERMLEAVPRVTTKELRSRRTRAVLALARLQDHPKRRDSEGAAETFLRLEREVRDTRERSARVVASWRHYLRGLWWSGLRLEESLELYWDRGDKLQPDFASRFPMLRIPAELEKGNRDRLLPMAPEFAEFLEATPDGDRFGRIFGPLGTRSDHLTSGRICRIISAIGEAAAVKVQERGEKVKYASAHDLRRAFGLRWSRRVMPAQLRELMRHESIETTMKFYVGQNAESTAATLWEAVGSSNTLGNSAADSSSEYEQTPPQVDTAEGVCE